ncbi:hypothetical protein EZV62_002257 [Acer yangbiense]|uniref:Uncharacterized protein n=1 Tax=Acer yangbiense TaxID=1000413 RepID=A0A5C7IX36_9ROSI|nr:hypothetical protein EZV62_002257 [Acer yangbiense]
MDKQAWIALVEGKIDRSPKMLNRSAGKESCCIFRVPQSLVEINEKAYQPHIVSMGPYHHGKQHLKMIQQHKWRYLSSLLARTRSHGVGFKDLFESIEPLEQIIRECYSEIIEFDSCQLIEMMVLDGCFVIELFCMQYYSLPGKHLLGLFRESFIPPSQETTRESSPFLQLIPSAKKLHLAGIEFKPRRTNSFLDIKFSNGVLEIPPLTIDDFTTSVFLNIVAFEQCYRHCTKHITTYATLMGCLINTPGDAGFLSDQKIIENYFGTDEEMGKLQAHLFRHAMVIYVSLSSSCTASAAAALLRSSLLPPFCSAVLLRRQFAPPSSSPPLCSAILLLLLS